MQAVSSPPDAIQAQALHCRRGGVDILKGVSLSIPCGSFVGLFGGNGAGKTTLLECLLGLCPAAGQIHLFGKPIAQVSTELGYVPQDDGLATGCFLQVSTYLTAAWQAQRWGGWIGRKAQSAVQTALDDMALSHLAKRRLSELSGGQRQRVRIAQALVNPIRALFLDEPLSHLDPEAQQHVLNLLQRLRRERGLCILLSAHNINPLLPHMDQVLYLAAGRASQGSVDSVVTSANLSTLYGCPMTVTRNGRYRFIHPAEATSAQKSINT